MTNWFKIEFIFAHKFHISPIDLEKLEFYRIHYLLKEYEEYIEKENEEYKKQQRESERQSKISSNLPSPNYGGFKVPKVDIPKFDIPKFQGR